MTLDKKLTGGIERLSQFQKPAGFMNFGRIPYKIYLNLNSSPDDTVNQSIPARYMITPDLNLDKSISYSLSVLIWEGVPKNFKEILFYHELKEAEFMLADKLSKKEAHEKAVAYHVAYAKKFLDEDTFEKFMKWQSQYGSYSSRNFF